MAIKITYRYAPRGAFKDNDDPLPFSGSLTIECNDGLTLNNASEKDKEQAALGFVDSLLTIKYPADYPWAVREIVSIEPVDSKQA